MLTRDELKGQWTEVKDRLQEHWHQLSEADLSTASESADQLIGIVQQKTGAARNEIEDFLDGVVAEGRSTANKVSQAASHYAEQASDIAQQQYSNVADATADMSKRVAHTVRNRPTESLAIAFGLGIAVGALALMGRRNR